MNSSVIKSPEAIDSLNIPQIGILPRVEKLKRGFHILQMFVEDGVQVFQKQLDHQEQQLSLNLKKIKVI